MYNLFEILRDKSYRNRAAVRRNIVLSVFVTLVCVQVKSE